ncbi:MAG TPA: Rv3654c family TadE-like protein [Flexivirga sp.]|uniref:Rv3654c family TadE-like protein n=1 Tax=Flexivirga sp. TaxID=1962927 RepID=UPI002CF8ACCA|nr:Rv3654c family TadE-like protein [Flexivirga sp.]HWC24835.1 Rv3654c family TadE-like protein [Flexivirga sp.]
MRRRASSERGSATVLVVMAIGVVLLCLAGALALLSAVQASHRARAAADLAALAGAQVLVGGGVGGAGSPCDVAAGVAARNGAALIECSIAGDDLTVRVATRAGWPGLGRAQARARAGPEPAPSRPPDPVPSKVAGH